MSNKRLEGEKVFLTPISYDDCEDFVRWRNSDFIRERFIYRKTFTVEDQIKWIKNKVEPGFVVQFIIWDKADNKKIGSVYLLNVNHESKDAEFGIMIGDEAYVGGGRGTESAKLIIEYGFKEIGLDRIMLRVLKDNAIARHTYEKIGFKPDNHEETIKIDDKDTEVVFMSIYNA